MPRHRLVALLFVAAALAPGAHVSGSHAGPGPELHPNGAGPVIASVEAETAVAGAFLLSPRGDREALDRAQEILAPSMFSRRDIGLVYAAAASLRLRGVQPDIITIAEHLKSHGQLDEAGGFDLLSALIDAVPSAANVEYHAKIVHQKAAARTYRTMLRTALRDVEQAERPLADILQEHRERVDGMSRAQVAQDTDAPVFTTLADLRARPELLEPPACVLSRIAYRGHGTLLSGPDKSGKSTLLAHGAAATTRQGAFLDGRGVLKHEGKVVWLGLEESTGHAVRRFLDVNAVPDRAHLVTRPVADLLLRTDALLGEWPADLLVLDSLSEYARITVGKAPEDGENGAWGALVRPWVALARRHDVALVILHHVRRSDGKTRGAGDIMAGVDALLELEMPQKAEDPTLRRFTGRGRWPVEPFSVALRDTGYELSGGAELSLDARLLLHIEQDPGQSQAALSKAVGTRKESVIAALNRLETRGAVRNRGDSRGSAYFSTSMELDLEDL